MSKRKARGDESEDLNIANQVASELYSTLERGPDAKLQALTRLIELIDHSDELYTAQTALANADAVFCLTELLQDQHTAVGIKAAHAIKVMSEHSASAIAKLSSGPLIGLESSVTRVILNPLQDDFIDNNAVQTLVDWLLSQQEIKVMSAQETLYALCSYNHDGKVAFLEQLVQRFITAASNGSQKQQLQAMDHIDTVIDGLDTINDDVERLIDQILKPLSSIIMSSSSSPSSQSEHCINALVLLGTICLKKKNFAENYLIIHEEMNESPIKPLIKLLLQGPLLIKDAAARAVWSVVGQLPSKKQEILLHAQSSALQGCLESVVAQLRMLIAEAQAEDDAADENFERVKQGFVSGADVEATEVCYADEAQSLLGLIVKYNPEARREEDELSRKASCVVM